MTSVAIVNDMTVEGAAGMANCAQLITIARISGTERVMKMATTCAQQRVDCESGVRSKVTRVFLFLAAGGWLVVVINAMIILVPRPPYSRTIREINIVAG
jgi:hypothetical protein